MSRPLDIPPQRAIVDERGHLTLEAEIILRNMAEVIRDLQSQIDALETRVEALEP